MTSQDVRSILNLPQAGPSQHSAPRRAAPAARKPDGISRELYALIGDNAPSLAEAQASLAAVKYRERPSVRAKKVHWEWREFTPSARQENPVKLGHWARVTDEDPDASVEYFGKFNLNGPSVMEYSQYEYDQYLADPNWSPHETAYLFEILREYDLRFVVAADRYDYVGPSGSKRRSIEEMKDRYYAICRRLLRNRTATDPQAQQQLIHSYSFDKTREENRKKYASNLFHLTASEVAEEEALYVEVKRLEQNERRFRADRDELMRSVMGMDSGLIQLDNPSMESVLGVDKNKKKRRLEEESAGPSTPAVQAPPKMAKNPAFDAAHCIYHVPPPPVLPHTSHLASKHPIHVPVYLRSTKLPAPKQTAAIRITELLNELGISAQKLVMPTRQNIEMFDGLLVASGALVDMKRQVDRVEQELRTVRAQKEGLEPAAVVAPQARADSVTSTDTSLTNNRQSRPPL
ncbi:hypothetical protein IAT38_003833 [Cryptococcus sp. DSM 104549]